MITNLSIWKLWCRTHFHYWIVVDFEWKSVGIERPVAGFSSTQSSKGPQLLGQLNLEIRLLNQVPQVVQTFRPIPPVFNSLTDDAFQPKLFSVRIEKGNFTEPSFVGSESPLRPRYTLRLVFDKSPYPPRHEWTNPDGGPDSGEFWLHKEFVARNKPELEKLGRAMNDPPPASDWNSCTIS